MTIFCRRLFCSTPFFVVSGRTALRRGFTYAFCSVPVSAPGKNRRLLLDKRVYVL